MSPQRAIVRDALGIGIASGAYAISFGAISTAAGLSLLQTCALSVLMFTGASQFALVGVVGAGGSVWAGAAAAALLGSRNALYGLRLSSLLKIAGLRRIVASHIAIAAAVLAIAVLPFVPAGVPLLIVAVGVAVYGMFGRRA